MTKQAMPALAMTIMLSACAGGETSPETVSWDSDPRPLGKTLVYECLGTEFIARVGPGEMAIWLDDRYLVLSRLRGTREIVYQEADVTFRQQDDKVSLVAGGQTFPDCEIMAIDSPSGFTKQVMDFIQDEVKKLGFEFSRTKKGNGIITAGKDTSKALGLAAHVDTLGGMVTSITGKGTL